VCLGFEGVGADPSSSVPLKFYTAIKTLQALYNGWRKNDFKNSADFQMKIFSLLRINRTE
jgi:hypothetical protein